VVGVLDGLSKELDAVKAAYRSVFDRNVTACSTERWRRSA
jgi:hypothetical protein